MCILWNCEYYSGMFYLNIQIKLFIIFKNIEMIYKIRDIYTSPRNSWWFELYSNIENIYPTRHPENTTMYFNHSGYITDLETPFSSVYPEAKDFAENISFQETSMPCCLLSSGSNT